MKHRETTPRLRRTVTAIGLVVGAVQLDAHIVREAPWDPVPAAYLRSVFYLNLEPIPWQLVAAEYQQPLPGSGYQGQTVLDLLEDLPSTPNTPEEGDHLSAITTAIESQNREQLFRSTTIAISRRVRADLEAAEAELEEPGAAAQSVARAEGTFRAFSQNAIAIADPNAARLLGRAWLELSSSVGTKGVLGIGEEPAQHTRFVEAKAIVDEYLITNYERLHFAPSAAGHYAPVPVVGTDTTIDRLANLLPPGTNLNDQNPLPTLRLNFEARGIDEADLFLVAYGDMLFDSPAIFGEPAKGLALSCATCHNRSDINRDFFIPGISHQPGAADVDGHFFNPRFNDRSSDSIDIPSLRGLRFTAPYGRNGRFASLRDFTRNVIVNEFAGAEPTPFMLDALVAYMFEFDWLAAPVLRADGSLDPAVASAAAIRGQDLFSKSFPGMGDRACATCHVPSANFLDRKSHDIGTAAATEPGARDTFFDTPTLLNSVHTAPYFHDGSQPTLRAVVEWFDQQHRLNLDDSEVADLTAYLEAVGSAVEPFQHFDQNNTPFGLAWDELSTFLTTLGTLLPARDREHTLLLLDTVTPDLRADVVGAWEPSAIADEVLEIADTLDQLRTAVERGQWPRAETIYVRYQELADAYGPLFN